MEQRKGYGFYYFDYGGHLDIEADEDFSQSNGLKDDIEQNGINGWMDDMISSSQYNGI